VPIIAPAASCSPGRCTTCELWLYHRRAHDDLQCLLCRGGGRKRRGFPEGIGTLLWTLAVSIPMRWF
jgi:hypothetical protein